MESLVQSLTHRGLFCRPLRLNYPFHSHYMEPARLDLVTSLQSIAPRKAKIRFVSTVTAQILMARNAKHRTGGETCGNRSCLRPRSTGYSKTASIGFWKSAPTRYWGAISASAPHPAAQHP